jgi:hypothetical protein
VLTDIVKPFALGNDMLMEEGTIVRASSYRWYSLR